MDQQVVPFPEMRFADEEETGLALYLPVIFGDEILLIQSWREKKGGSLKPTPDKHFTDVTGRSPNLVKLVEITNPFMGIFAPFMKGHRHVMASGYRYKTLSQSVVQNYSTPAIKSLSFLFALRRREVGDIAFAA
jgi:hypothetical protein